MGQRVADVAVVLDDDGLDPRRRVSPRSPRFGETRPGDARQEELGRRFVQILDGQDDALVEHVFSVWKCGNFAAGRPVLPLHRILNNRRFNIIK